MSNKKLCEICGDDHFVTSYLKTGQLLCKKHKQQIVRKNKITDPTPTKTKKLCKENNCNEYAIARGYCQLHYNYHKDKGTFKTKKCNVKGCNKNIKSKGLCSKHYQQLKNFGYIKPTRYEENKYIMHNDKGYAEIIIYDSEGNEKEERLIIDIEDVEKVKPYKWNIHYKTKYGKTKINGKYTTIHELILDFPQGVIDHIDRNPLNNRKSNLRIVDMSRNAHNRSLPKNNTSGVKGVWFNKQSNKWIAQINFQNKRYWLGKFDNKEDAIIARLKAEKEMFGEYSIYKDLWKDGEIDVSKIRNITSIN
jgi:AP2 domain/HNH endonuclease